HKQATKSTPKNSTPVGALIRPLQELAGFMTPGPKGGVAPLAVEVAGILEAAEGSVYPVVPPLAADRFNAFAEVVTLRWHAGPMVGGFPYPALYFPFPEVEISLHTQAGQEGVSGRAYWAAVLAQGYFVNRERDRLRRCPICRKWFVDVSNNKAAK